MGVSTNAILAYGIPLDEGAIEFSSSYAPTGKPPAGGMELLTYMRATGDAVDGIQLIEHCSDSHTMYVLAIASTERCARRGTPERIGASSFNVNPRWEKRLVDFAHRCGLTKKDFKGKAGWWLFSWWC